MDGERIRQVLSSPEQVAQHFKQHADVLVSHLVGKDVEFVQHVLESLSADQKPHLLFHIIEHGGSVNMVEGLIKQGVALNNEQYPPLLAAINRLKERKDRASEEIVRLLIKAGADVNAMEITTGIPLAFTLLTCCTPQLFEEITQHLVKSIKDSEGRDVMLYLAEHGAWDAFDHLLSTVKVDESVVHNGRGVIHRVCEAKRFDLLKKVVENNPKILLQRDEKGRVVIHYLIKLYGQNKDVKTRTEIEELFKLIITTMRQHNMDINVRNHEGKNALLYAAKYGDALELLDQYYPMFNNDEDVYGCNAVMIATVFKRKEAIEWLIEKGFDVNTPGWYGKTALHIAAYQGDEDMVKFLIEKGADVNAQTDKGNTPLHYAAMSPNFNPNVYNTLIKHGASSTTENKQGITPARILMEKDRHYL